MSQSIRRFVTGKPKMNQNAASGMLYAGLAAFLIGFGADLSSAEHWGMVFSPHFIGKALVQLGGVGVAIFGALKREP